jgi:glycosyltransferase 2 family protein
VKTVWKGLGLAAGLALFAWYVSRADWHSVGEALGRLGWVALLALLPYAAVYVVDCLGWRLCLPPKLGIPFSALFRIRWAGESVNLVVPSAYVGGEAVKVYLLRKKGISGQVGTSAAVVSKTAQSIGQLLCILLATAALFKLGSRGPAVHGAILTILIAGVALLVALFWVQRRGLFASLVKVASALRLKLGFIEKRWSKIIEVDEAISSFYRQHRPRFCAAIGVYFGGWLLDTLEIYVVSRLLGMPIEWTQALVVEAFISVVKLLGLWVPGSFGVQESGIMLLGRLAGLPDTLSVAYPILRRGRELIFALVGWLLLYTEHIGLGKILAESDAPGTSPTPASPQ